jgi:hydroxymethylbilane synthase
VNSSIQDEQLGLIGMVASLDGERLIKDQCIGNINDPEKVGKDLANKLKLQGADKILNEIFEQFREK